MTYTYNRDNLLRKFEKDTGTAGPTFTFGGTEGPQSDLAKVDGLG
jgi:hypothetical protein